MTEDRRFCFSRFRILARSRTRRIFLVSLGAVVFFGGLFLLLVVLPHWSSRKQRNEAAAIETLRELNSAITRYRAQFPEVGFPASLHLLIRKVGPVTCSNVGLLHEGLAADRFVRHGYVFEYRLSEGLSACPPSLTPDPGTDFVLRAAPFFPGQTGDHSFHLDATGIVRQSRSEVADPGGEPVEVFQPAAALVAPAGILLRDVIALPATAYRSPPVVFDHKAHVEERLIDCAVCHHSPRPERLPQREFQPCRDCHEGAIRVPMTTSFKTAFHDAMAGRGTCIDCHKLENAKGKNAPLECQDCHRSQTMFRPVVTLPGPVERMP